MSGTVDDPMLLAAEYALGTLDASGAVEKYRDKILLLKDVGAEELKRYVRGAQLLVSPSFYEGFDYPAAEALALGRNVVISRGSAHEEFRGANVQFYSPADDAGALAREIKSGLNRAAATSGAHNVPSLDEMLVQTLKVYETAAGKL